MYRFVIEHPRWIPAESLANVDPRAGSNLGRIYRVRSANATELKWPKLSEMDAEQLVAAMDSDNGWQRDMAMQLLVWNADKFAQKAIEPLRKLANKSKREVAQVQAWATLAQLQAINTQDVLQTLSAKYPAVRRIGIQLAEKYANRRDQESQDILVRLTEMADDRDPQVRLQLAQSLGQWQESSAAETLAHLALGHTKDRYLQAAIVGSLQPAFLNDFLESIVNAGTLGAEELAPSILPLALSMSQGDQAREIFERAIAMTQASGSADVWKALTTMIDRIEKSTSLRAKLGDLLVSDQLLELRKSTFDMLKEKVYLEDDQSASFAGLTSIEVRRYREETNKMLAVSMDCLHRSSLPEENRKEDHDLLLDMLTPQTPLELQAAAIRGLMRIDTATAASDVLAHWKQLSPQLKNQLLQSIMSREAWIQSLLDEIEKSTVEASELDAARRSQLLLHRDAKIRARAEKLLAGKVNADRVQVLESYASVNKLQGNATRGKELFLKNCSTCHRLKDVGHAVGPDLDPLANKPTAFFLQEILDPNRNLDSRYMSYTAITTSGQTLTGLLASETATAITLRGSEAKEDSLQRSEIEQLSSTRASLMPEGLEKLLKPQDMADVIRYVQTFAAATSEDDEPAIETMAVGELARDILNDKLPNDARRKLVPVAAKSAGDVITAMAANLPFDEKEEYRRIPWIWQVAVAAGKEGNIPTLKQTIECSLPRAEQPLRDWQAVVIGGGVINGLGLRGDWPKQRIDEMIRMDAKLATKWEALLVQARAMADNEKIRKGTRYDALRIVAIDQWPKQRDQLLRYIGKDVDPELQMGAVSGLADVDNNEATELLLKHLPDMAPVNRKLAIVALAHGPARQVKLLDAIDSGLIKASEVAKPERESLLQSTDEAIRQRAARFF